MNNWDGAGKSQPSPTINPSGIGAFCDYSSTPAAKVKTAQVTFDFEAWFTGAVDTASLASNIARVDSKLVGYLASSVGLCDTLACTANANNCIDIYNKANTLGTITGISKNTTDIIQTGYLCEQPKPVNQLPIFNRIVCIPVTATLAVNVSAQFNSTQVQTFVWDTVNAAMKTGQLTTDGQVVGLVFTGTPHTKMNASGTIKKEMRGLGLGLLIAGCVILFLLIAAFIVWRVIKRRNRNEDEEEYDDLSLEKDEEESFAQTDSFQTDDPSPKSDRYRITYTQE
jgi:hypothetical protein